MSSSNSRGIRAGVQTAGYWLGRRSHSSNPLGLDPTAHPDDEYKLALVVRMDLKMSTGKIAAQCSHATLACYAELRSSNPAILRCWEQTGQTKVALRCVDEKEMQILQTSARRLNLCAKSIRDAGRTQIATGSRTVLGIGPGPARLVSQVTGKLKLL
ncbi:peptidyl-tRNA hydrolase II [Heliocybe sulcata]|uniref:peptidyl-tRNA hydrolase n=1 Tax=Heliocybe sulcata TaxID=5364 RepID=A0A5C3NIA8_9AGAM|nr:peptidyl-tRNA hydrolase II [Heliocybe sulcata]